MKTFSEILRSTAKGEAVIFAPPPQNDQALLVNELKGSGYLVKEEGGASPEEAVKKAFQEIFTAGSGVLVQGGMSLEDFWTVIIKECGVDLRRLCFVSVFEDSRRGKLLFAADTYIHNFPTLREKIHILEQVLGLTAKLGMTNPLVAALSALETVNPALPSTVEAAALSKMGQRGQFSAEVEGPLDIDTALSSEAALRKGIKSNVPGEVDILLCPDIESAYALSQFFSWLGKMPTAGVLLGAPVPLVIHPSFISPAHKHVEVALAASALGA